MHKYVMNLRSAYEPRPSVIRRFERSNAVEIHDGITFDFYTGLPHMLLYRHLAMIGPLLIHVKKDYPGYHFFASALVSRCPDLATLYCFGTDGEAAQGVCVWCSW